VLKRRKTGRKNQPGRQPPPTFRFFCVFFSAPPKRHPVRLFFWLSARAPPPTTARAFSRRPAACFHQPFAFQRLSFPPPPSQPLSGFGLVLPSAYSVFNRLLRRLGGLGGWRPGWFFRPVFLRFNTLHKEWSQLTFRFPVCVFPGAAAYFFDFL